MQSAPNMLLYITPVPSVPTSHTELTCSSPVLSSNSGQRNNRDINLLLILSANKLLQRWSVLQLLLQELVDSEGHSLSRSDSHNTWGDTLVKGVEALLLEHICCNVGNSAPCALAWNSWSLLETGLDGIDWSVREWAHSTGNEADQGSLVRWKLSTRLGDIFWLKSLKDGLELSVCGEVDSLVGTWEWSC